MSKYQKFYLMTIFLIALSMIGYRVYQLGGDKVVYVPSDTVSNPEIARVTCNFTYNGESKDYLLTENECNDLIDFMNRSSKDMIARAKAEVQPQTVYVQPRYVPPPIQYHYSNCMTFGNVTNCSGN